MQENYTETDDGFLCEQCDRLFDTERGVRTHVGRMHDPLPEDKAVELYIYENLTAEEIAERVGISKGSVDTRLVEYDLYRKDPATWKIDDQGYPAMYSNDRIRLHRLIAIAKGANPHTVFSGQLDVDHINGFKADNRPENIRLIDKHEHGAKHSKEGANNQYDKKTHINPQKN